MLCSGYAVIEHKRLQITMGEQMNEQCVQVNSTAGAGPNTKGGAARGVRWIQEAARMYSAPTMRTVSFNINIVFLLLFARGGNSAKDMVTRRPNSNFNQFVLQQ